MVMPILMFLAMAVSEGAAFVRAHQVLNNAAREGARMASAEENLNGWDATGQNSVGIQAACDYLRANSGAFVKWDATQDTTCSNTAFTIQVTRLRLTDIPSGVAMSASKAVVTYKYPLQMFPALPWVGLPNPLPLRGTAEFRNLY
jgi:Flp pilus assembly protein TadG